MPFKNDCYEPDTHFKLNMREFIASYLNSETGKCRKEEYKSLLTELLQIEESFYKLLDATLDEQDLSAQDPTITTAEEMKKFAIPRILNILNDLYEHRHGTIPNEIAKKKKDRAKRIWKEYCKERQRCPRAGVLLLLDNKILLVKYKTDGTINYGHSKGKIEIGETIHQCAARECNEELGLSISFILNQIQNRPPIRKDVPYTYDGLTYKVEHYYFIVEISSQMYNSLQPNEHEIEDIELNAINSLPCYRYCPESSLSIPEDETDESEQETNHYMVSCANFTMTSSLVWDILNFFDEKNGNKDALKKYKEKHRYYQRKNSKF